MCYYDVITCILPELSSHKLRNLTVARHDALAFARASRSRRCDRSRKADGPYSPYSTCQKVAPRAFTGGYLRGRRVTKGSGCRVPEIRWSAGFAVRLRQSRESTLSQYGSGSRACTHTHVHTARDVTLYTRIQIHSPF